jgi:hypothetical protein
VLGEAIACFTAQFSHFPRGTEQTVTPIWTAGFQFKPGTSQKQKQRNANNYATILDYGNE